VAIFFLVTGYVNSIGAIGKARAGNYEAAFTGIARSSLARSGRLVLPTMVATFITWLIANVNGYHMTKHVDATWIRQGWHRQEPTVWMALVSLFKAETETWTIGWNDYDGTQWTLHMFVEASMLVYITMFATVMVKPKARLLVYAVLYAYFWKAGDGESRIKNLTATANMSRSHKKRHQRPQRHGRHVRSRAAQPLQRFRHVRSARPDTRDYDCHGHVPRRIPARRSGKCALVAHNGTHHALSDE
jgi:hypothetical protein